MTVFYGTNNNAYFQTEPVQKMPPGEAQGRMFCAYDEYVVPAGGTLTTTDSISMQKVPKGARIVDCKVYSDAGGGAGAIDVGLNPDVDGGVLDADRLIDGLDAGAAAAMASMMDGGAGVLAGVNSPFAKLTEESEVVVTPVTDYTAAPAVKIAVWVFYVME